MTMAIPYVTFEASARCNMDCAFCFSYWRDGAHEIGTGQVKRILHALCGHGLEAINFTGGEPLLRRDIVELVRFAKEEGLATILTTNGILLSEKLPALAPALDFVGLPLDSITALRPTRAVPDHHALVLGLIKEIASSYSSIGLKINTVVTGENADSILPLGSTLEHKVVAWKLSRFLPGGYGQSHADRFAVARETYDALVAACRQTYPTINSITSDAHEGDDYCRVLSPDGRLLKPEGDRLIDLGPVLSLTEEQMTAGFDAAANRRFLKKTHVAGGSA